MEKKTILQLLPLTDAPEILLHDICALFVATLLSVITLLVVLLCTIQLSLSLQKSQAWRDKNKYTSSKSTNTPDEDSQLALKESKEIRAVKMLITPTTVFSIVIFIPGFRVDGRFSRLFEIVGMFLWV